MYIKLHAHPLLTAAPMLLPSSQRHRKLQCRAKSAYASITRRRHCSLAQDLWLVVFTLVLSPEDYVNSTNYYVSVPTLNGAAKFIPHMKVKHSARIWVFHENNRLGYNHCEVKYCLIHTVFERWILRPVSIWILIPDLVFYVKKIPNLVIIHICCLNHSGVALSFSQ